MTPAGLEPAIPGSVGRCLIHWATGPLMEVPLIGQSARTGVVLPLFGSSCVFRCAAATVSPTQEASMLRSPNIAPMV